MLDRKCSWPQMNAPLQPLGIIFSGRGVWPYVWISDWFSGPLISRTFITQPLAGYVLFYNISQYLISSPHHDLILYTMLLCNLISQRNLPIEEAFDEEVKAAESLALRERPRTY